VGAETPAGAIGQDAVQVLPAGGRLRARLATDAADLAATQALRHLCFVEAAGGRPRPGGIEADDRDPLCRHVMVEETATGGLLCSFRIMDLPSGAAIGESYAAQFYDLSRLATYPRPMVELGRFCIRPGTRDADVLRLAWGAIARIVDTACVGMLFGCSSFAGTDPAPYRGAFALIAGGSRAPEALAPGMRAAEVVPLGEGPVGDRRQALAAVPPLLRTYLGMGGWVSDHAVVDREMGTLHVFTAVETGAVPAARARALRAVLGPGEAGPGAGGGAGGG
jgi:putative hemolysin